METPSTKAFSAPCQMSYMWVHTWLCESWLRVLSPWVIILQQHCTSRGFRERPSLSGEAAAYGCQGTGCAAPSWGRRLQVLAGPQQQICWQHSSGKCTVPLSPARSSLIQAPHTATFATVLPTPHKVAAALPHTQRGPSDPSPCSCKWEGMLSMDSVIASSPGGLECF